MSSIMRYDPEADAMHVRISSRKAWESLEINQNLNLDLDHNGHPVGIELLDMRKFVSALFGHSIDSGQLKNLKVKALSPNGQEVILDLHYGAERIRYAIPGAYASPVVAIM